MKSVVLLVLQACMVAWPPLRVIAKR